MEPDTLNLHRGTGDPMRYAALVSFADSTEFGPYRMLDPQTKRFQTPLPDSSLYAMALYMYSLESPPNPNPRDERAAAGEKIFRRESCVSCHTPPLFTNNKLTAGLALKMRQRYGYCKVPSLKGVWYRGHYLHDGVVASLEELFDPRRLEDSHTPGGWRPPGVQTRAIPGHEFGLRLPALEREQLIAYLRTL